MTQPIPYSILDLSPIVEDGTAQEALNNTIKLACKICVPNTTQTMLFFTRPAGITSTENAYHGHHILEEYGVSDHFLFI